MDAATVKDQYDWLMKPRPRPHTEEVHRLPEEISRVVDTFLENPEVGEVRQRPLRVEEEEFSRVRNDYDEIYSDGMVP